MSLASHHETDPGMGLEASRLRSELRLEMKELELRWAWKWLYATWVGSMALTIAILGALITLS
ncbi:MAG TPA: hypothetical protein VJS15_03510 [Allosphingosinicella sp.]|nr:hypothetical protein [Allosphingosinicella sp.]